jgi:hypothetical protein
MIAGIIASVLIYPAALVVLTAGGNLACRSILSVSRTKITRTPEAAVAAGGPPPEIANEARALRAGRMVGSLEGILIMAGLIAQSWEVMVAVIALKTVARYRDLVPAFRME